MTRSPSFSIENKLRTTIIPQIDFEGADLETIRRALITLSRQYDPEVSKGGVNFVVSSDITDASLVNLHLWGLVRGLRGAYFCKYAIFRERTGFAADAVGFNVLPKYARTTQEAKTKSL